MSSLVERQFFSPSCPTEGTWFACSTGTRFVGCCVTDDPCANGCLPENVRAGTYDAAHYGNIPASSCAEGADFYTCRDTTPPFLGCCKDNPCVDGCSQQNLAPGYLERPAQFSIYNATGTIASSTVFSTGSSTSTPTSGTGQASAVPAGNKSNTAAIAGGAAGGGVALLIIIGLVIFFLRRKKSRAAAAAAGEKDSLDKTDGPSNYASPASTYNSQFPDNQTFELPGSFAPIPNEQKNRFSADAELDPDTARHELSPQSRLSELPHEEHVAELSPDPRRSELESPFPSPIPRSPRSPVSAEHQPRGGAEQQSPLLGSWSDEQGRGGNVK